MVDSKGCVEMYVQCIIHILKILTCWEILLIFKFSVFDKILSIFIIYFSYRNYWILIRNSRDKEGSEM